MANRYMVAQGTSHINNQGKVYESSEHDIKFFEAGENAAKAFQATEKALDFIPPFIKLAIR